MKHDPKLVEAVARLAADLCALLTELDGWKAENAKKQTACEQMGARITKLEAERDGWMQAAARHCQNEEWLRGLLVQIGERFGEAARTSDDGSVQDSVLLLKVPELVDALLAERDALRARLDAIGVLEQPGALTVNCVRGSLRCTERERIEAERDQMRKAAVKLWMLLDDIDMLDDAVGANDAAFRAHAQQRQRKRFDIMSGEDFCAAVRAALKGDGDE